MGLSKHIALPDSFCSCRRADAVGDLGLGAAEVSRCGCLWGNDLLEHAALLREQEGPALQQMTAVQPPAAMSAGGSAPVQGQSHRATIEEEEEQGDWRGAAEDLYELEEGPQDGPLPLVNRTMPVSTQPTHPGQHELVVPGREMSNNVAQQPGQQAAQPAQPLGETARKYNLLDFAQSSAGESDCTSLLPLLISISSNPAFSAQAKGYMAALPGPWTCPSWAQMEGPSLGDRASPPRLRQWLSSSSSLGQRSPARQRRSPSCQWSWSP